MRAVTPPLGLVLEYYSGIYESVYVILSPFIKPLTIDPQMFYPGTYPKKRDLLRGGGSDLLVARARIRRVQESGRS